jgi:hypothetical protein
MLFTLFIIDDVIWKMLLKIVNEDIGDHKYIEINIKNCPFMNNVKVILYVILQRGCLNKNMG